MISIKDPKFRIVASRAGVPLVQVAAVWAYFIDSENLDADLIGGIEFESADHFFHIPEGTSKIIYSVMLDLGLLTLKKSSKSGALKESRKTRLPVGFYPNEHGVEKAEELGVSIALEYPRFVDYHSAKGSTMSDWNAAWRTWIGNAAKFGNAGKSRRASIEERNRASGVEWLKHQGAQ